MTLLPSTLLCIGLVCRLRSAVQYRMKCPRGIIVYIPMHVLFNHRILNTAKLKSSVYSDTLLCIVVQVYSIVIITSPSSPSDGDRLISWGFGLAISWLKCPLAPRERPIDLSFEIELLPTFAFSSRFVWEGIFRSPDTLHRHCFGRSLDWNSAWSYFSMYSAKSSL